MWKPEKKLKLENDLKDEKQRDSFYFTAFFHLISLRHHTWWEKPASVLELQFRACVFRYARRSLWTFVSTFLKKQK